MASFQSIATGNWSSISSWGLGVPAAPSLSASSWGGSLANSTTYWFFLTYQNGSGETIVSTGASVATPAGTGVNSITVTSPAANGNATNYRVYMFTSNTSTSSHLQATTALGTNTTITTYNTGGAAPPTTNTAAPAAVPGDGDSVTLVSTFQITLDQNVGTAGNGIFNILIVGSATTAGLYCTSPASAYTMIFGSTGVDPIGSGTSSPWAPSATATMFGIAIGKGTLQLHGTPTNPITLTSASGTAPHYITYPNQVTGAAANSGGAIDLQYCVLNHLGANSTNAYGIWFDGHAGAACTVKNTKFLDPYYAIRASTVVTNLPTIDSVYVNAPRATAAFYFPAALFNNLAITNCTLDGVATNQTYLASFLFTPQNLTFTGNAVIGASNSIQAGLIAKATTGASTGGNTYSNNFAYNYTSTSVANSFSTQALAIGLGPSATVADVASQNILSGGYQCVAISSGAAAAPATISGNWIYNGSDATPGQGFLQANGGTIRFVNNVVVGKTTLTTGSPFICFSYSVSNAAPVTPTWEHNTLSWLGSVPSQLAGIYLGDSGLDPITNGRVRANLVVGPFGGNAQTAGIADEPSITGTNTGNTYMADAAGGGYGCYNNNVYGATIAYSYGALNAPTYPGTVFTGTTGTGGFLLHSTTYWYKVTCYNANGESGQAVEKSVTTGAGADTYQTTFNWLTVPGASGYKVYRSTTSGAEQLLATVAGQSSSSYVDNTNTVPSGSYPSNTTAWTSTGFWDYTHTHPDATYGDVNAINPNFLDTTRTVEGYSTLRGGAGTAQDIINQLALRWNGTNNASYSMPDMLSYLMAGWRPSNLALQNTTYSGDAVTTDAIGLPNQSTVGALAVYIAPPAYRPIVLRPTWNVSVYD